MIEIIRIFLKKTYEKNKKTFNIVYLLSLIMIIITKKHRTLKEDINSAFESYSTKNKLSKKEKNKIKKEMILFRIIYKVRPSEYFLYDISNKSISERETYITREMTNKYYKKINNFKAIHIFNDKYLSYKVFKKLYNRNIIYISNENDKQKFIEFAKENKNFVLKKIDGHGGEGIEFICIEDGKNCEQIFESQKANMPYILEEYVNQNEKLACFHPKSLNTVRVVTFQLNGKTSIIWSFLRVGQGNSSVDNMNSGGLGAQVDVSTGKIISQAIDYFGNKVEKHPDTGIEFEGYQLPEWEKLQKIVAELSSKIPSIHCVGWDMAYSNKGWTLIEGNGRAQVVTIQTLTERGYKDIFEKMAYLCIEDKKNREMVIE